jgi:hypothetical protein
VVWLAVHVDCYLVWIFFQTNGLVLGKEQPWPAAHNLQLMLALKRLYIIIVSWCIVGLLLAGLYEIKRQGGAWIIIVVSKSWCANICTLFVCHMSYNATILLKSLLTATICGQQNTQEL